MTAADLVTLGQQLNAFASQIDTYIRNQPNPYDPKCIKLRTLEGQIGSDANQLAGLAIATLTPDVATATQNLTKEVQSAQTKLQTVSAIQQALQVVGAVLSVAVSAGTGNPFSVASSVAQLASNLQSTLKMV